MFVCCPRLALCIDPNVLPSYPVLQPSASLDTAAAGSAPAPAKVVTETKGQPAPRPASLARSGQAPATPQQRIATPSAAAPKVGTVTSQVLHAAAVPQLRVVHGGALANAQVGVLCQPVQVHHLLARFRLPRLCEVTATLPHILTAPFFFFTAG